MSLNAILDQEYLPDVEASLTFMSDFIAARTSALTLEEKLLIEAQAVSLLEQFLNADVPVAGVIAGQHPESTELGGFYDNVSKLLTVDALKERSLIAQYLRYHNNIQLIMYELIGLLKRIRQKKSALDLWSDEAAKFVVSENFLNLERLDATQTSVPEGTVIAEQGIFTLPVRNRSKRSIQSIRIGGDSNGTPGNSDLAVTVNNTSPDFMINNDVDNWFEYERLDSGPVKLTLNLELPQETVVNELTIEPVNLGVSIPFIVDSIIFNNSEGTVPMEKLVPPMPKGFRSVKSTDNDSAWSVTFLPVKAKNIIIKLVQHNSYQIEVATPDGGTAVRDRYAIAIHDISIFTNEYSSVGGINSILLSKPKALYAGEAKLRIWPTNKELFSLKLQVSLDGASSWKHIPLKDIFKLQGNEDTFMWRVTLERLDDKFKFADSFTIDRPPIRKTSQLLRAVSRFNSPAEIPLNSRIKDESVFVIQPRIGRRGDRHSGILLGTGTGTASRLEVPVNLRSGNFSPEQARLFVNRIEYAMLNDDSSVTTGKWAFTADYREIVLPSDVPQNAEIVLVFDEEIMHFEERADGFYHKTDFLLDPDKLNIDIWHLPGKPKQVDMILPRDRTSIDLGYRNILSNTFELQSLNGIVYNKVNSRAEVFDAVDNDYYVDFVNGILYTSSPFGSDTVRVIFKHLTSNLVNKDAFELVYEDNKPWGVRINKDALEGSLIKEIISDPPKPVISILTGELGARNDVYSTATNAKTLSYDCIIKGSVKVSSDLLNTTTEPVEVDFIDGRSEFLGLIPMLSEETVETVALLDFVEFKLAAGALWYKEFDVSFSDKTVFSNKVSSRSAAQTGSIGDYFVSDNGLVTVNVGAGNTLPGGIDINYYYRNPEFDPTNKYSIDYRKGYLYSFSDLNPDASITYKVACYKIAYDIAKEVDSYTYQVDTSSVVLRTEGLNRINSLVKVIWTSVEETSTIEELRDFFSPILSRVAFRFT